MALSYWDWEQYSDRYDILIVGAGYTGCFAALEIVNNYPGAPVALLDLDPWRASSRRNAGFACYGSLSEHAALLRSGLDQADLYALCRRRLAGIQELREQLGDEYIDFRHCGGMELFTGDERALYERLVDDIPRYNDALLQSGLPQAYSQVPVDDVPADFAYGIYHAREGLLNPARALDRVRWLVRSAGVDIHYGVTIDTILEHDQGVQLVSSEMTWSAHKVLIATNGFTNPRWPMAQPTPSRNQVILSDPVDHGLPEHGYHYHEGYIYFRPIGDRLLIGGARHTGPEVEQTAELGTTPAIIDYLKNWASSHLLGGKDFPVAHSWSGILGHGEIVPKVQCQGDLCTAVGYGGMGVALSAQMGREAGWKLLHG